MSDSSQVGLFFLPEVTWGTTPASALTAMRYTSEDLAETIETKASDEVRADRMVSDLSRVGFGVGGSINFEYSVGTWDAFLEAALGGAFAVDILKNGSTKKSFTLEKKFADKALFHSFTGMMINSLSLSIASKQVITGKMDFIGKAGATAAVSVGTGDPTAATTFDIMTASANVGTLKEGGSALGAGIYLKKIDLQISNGLRGMDAVGNQGNVGVGQGRFELTGVVEAYFESWALYNKFKAGTATSLEFTITDGTKSDVVLIPKIKFSDAKVVGPGNGQDVMVPLSFTALYDSVETCMIKWTRDRI